jgi:hypothetical protein
VTTQQTSAYTKSFTAAVPGSYYVALDVPAEYSFEANLTIDADTTVTASGPTLYVDPTLTVMDRQRAFTLTVACGYAPGTPQAAFGAAEGLGWGTIATNGSTITIQPGSTGLIPTETPPTECALDFTDALLGFPRENATASEFTLHAAPRTVVYVNTGGAKPVDTTASGQEGLSNAVSAIPSETPFPVIAARDGYSMYDPVSFITITKPALILGGCDGTTWTRGRTHGMSIVNVPASTTVSTLTVSGGASGTVFDSLRILRGNSTVTASHATILIADTTRFRDCEIRFQDTSINPPGTDVAYAYLRFGAEAELDRCTIVGGTVSINATTYIGSVRAVEVTTIISTRIVNSVISPGTVTATGPASSFSNGVYVGVAGDATLNVAGSTISAGAGSSSNHRFNSVYSLYPLTLRMSNCLLISDNTNGQPANYALYTPSTSSTNVRNTLLAYPLDPASADIALVDGTSRNAEWWPMAVPTANLFSLLGALSLGSTAPTSPDYLKPAGSSPLTTGGVALTTAIAGFTPGGGADAFLVDRSGNPRTAPWTIGAYEY